MHVMKEDKENRSSQNRHLDISKAERQNKELLAEASPPPSPMSARIEKLERKRETLEREAEELLDSIRQDELDSRRSGDADASMLDDDDDDDDSIGGDMDQLSKSVAQLQHDLETADYSHLDATDCSNEFGSLEWSLFTIAAVIVAKSIAYAYQNDATK